MMVKSIVNTEFTAPCPGTIPAKTTARCASMAVKEKPLQGGGLSPVITGDDQTPGKQVAQNLTIAYVYG